VLGREGQALQIWAGGALGREGQALQIWAGGAQGREGQALQIWAGGALGREGQALQIWAGRDPGTLFGPERPLHPFERRQSAGSGSLAPPSPLEAHCFVLAP